MTPATRVRRVCTRTALVAVVLCGAGACVSTTAGPDGNYVRPMGNAPVTPNPTPYSTALSCVGGYAAQYGLKPPRIAVGRVSDLTGRLDDTGGRAVTQGGALMAMSALGKAGVPLVERYETDVSRLEYKLADNKLISDAAPGEDGRRDYRPVFAGDVNGSDLFLTGGITELNSNLRSSKGDAEASKGKGTVKVASLSGNVYVMNVGIDLRLVDTRTLNVVDIVSYQKQIVGHQIDAGLFSFFGGNVVSLSAGAGGEEPIHLAVRSLIERAVLQMMTKLYRMPDPQGCLNPALDPLGPTIVSETPAGVRAAAVAYGPAPTAYAAAPVAYAPPPAAYAPAPAAYGPAQPAYPPPGGYWPAMQASSPATLPAPPYARGY